METVSRRSPGRARRFCQRHAGMLARGDGATPYSWGSARLGNAKCVVPIKIAHSANLNPILYDPYVIPLMKRFRTLGVLFWLSDILLLPTQSHLRKSNDPQQLWGFFILRAHFGDFQMTIGLCTCRRQRIHHFGVGQCNSTQSDRSWCAHDCSPS